MQALIGQRLSSDINLAAQILILAGLWVGFYFARRKEIPRHQAIQTTMVGVNLFFILFVMVTSFYNYIIAGGTRTGTVANLMIVHGVLGLLAELTGIYLILRMSTQVLPRGLRVRNFKAVMRALLGLWTVLVVLGLGIYYYRYLAPRTVAVNPLVPVIHAADDVQIHAEEMAVSVVRGNLPTARRHAEHLINLIVGKSGAEYGDVDGNGTVEDPGDGTGALVIMDRVRDAASRGGGDAGRANALIDQMKDSMVRIAGDARAVVQAEQAGQVTQQMDDASAQAAQLRSAPDALVNQLGQALGLEVVRPAPAVQALDAQPGSVTVAMENFVYEPRTITVKPGTEVIFVNRDPAKHTVTADNGQFDSGDIAAGESYTLKLDQPGTYPYFCAFHGDKGGVDMSWTIVVEP